MKVEAGTIYIEDTVEAGKLSKLFGAAALSLLALMSASSAQDTSKVKNILSDLQNAKSIEMVDIAYQDLMTEISKLEGKDRNKLIEKAKEVKKEVSKQLRS